MKICIILYKHVSNSRNAHNAQQNYLSIELLLNLLTAFFVEKTRFLSDFFSNSEFGMRVHREKIEARSEGISLSTFLIISLRKINILRRTKLYPIELHGIYEMHVKPMLLNIMNI